MQRWQKGPRSAQDESLWHVAQPNLWRRPAIGVNDAGGASPAALAPRIEACVVSTAMLEFRLGNIAAMPTTALDLTHGITEFSLGSVTK
eukprot:1672857-Amphidinium_carterae.1